MYYIRDMNEFATLAARLIWARTQKDMTQDALAKAAGVSQSTIGNLESSTRLSSRRNANIASVLDVDALWLETGKGYPKARITPFQLHSTDEAVASKIQDVAKLVTWFGQASEHGKTQILRAAETAEKAQLSSALIASNDQT